MPADDDSSAKQLPTNNGGITAIKKVEVEGWQHGMVDDPLGYVKLRQGSPKALTTEQIKSYDKIGYVWDESWGCAAGRVMSEDDAYALADRVKRMEIRLGKSVADFGAMHLILAV